MKHKRENENEGMGNEEREAFIIALCFIWYLIWFDIKLVEN